ncbi:MAG TPA: type II CAAX endopeptidase family protein [Candidatus Polarisedimenticolia bacterium]|nr:type II CAAX endopeptidase family protein [Candidatus Polarisedimenticolia bacterium]
MTDPAGADPAGADPPDGSASAPGLLRFTTEGRTAPALFVVGWLATIAGLLGIAIAILGASGLTARLLFFAGAAAFAIGLCGLAGSQAIERRVAANPGYRGPTPLLIFLAWLPASYVAWVLVGLPLELAGIELDQLTTELLVLVIQSAIAIGLVGLLVVGPGVLSWPEIGFNRRVAGAIRELAWGALLAGPAILVTAVAATVLVQVFGVAPEAPFTPTGSPGGLAVHLLAGAIIAPLAEETIFRGVAINAWRPSLGVTGAIVRSALLFAAAHVLFVGGDSLTAAVAAASVGFLGRIPVALFLGWAFVRRGTIWAPLGLHVAFNAVLITAAELIVGGTVTAG